MRNIFGNNENFAVLVSRQTEVTRRSEGKDPIGYNPAQSFSKNNEGVSERTLEPRQATAGSENCDPHHSAGVATLQGIPGQNCWTVDQVMKLAQDMAQESIENLREPSDNVLIPVTVLVLWV
ncbi:MAG: hypothetical protein ACUVXJ_12990 [Phycisphaerae bacterium]